MANQVHIKLKKDYRGRGLVVLYELIEADLEILEKSLLAVKHTQDESYFDNYTRGQIVNIQKTLDTLKVLLNDNPD